MLNNNNIIAGIRSDNALATILSNFDTEFIINMVRDSINMRFRPYETSLPSLHSIEASFQAVLNNTDSSNIDKVMEVREKTYDEVIKEVCYYYGLEYTTNPTVDTYSAAFWIYDFFVSNFTSYFFVFIVNYIMTNKGELSHYIKLDPSKERNSSILYAKNVISDPDLANIHANLGEVLDNVFVMDITLQDIINYSMGVNNTVALFLNNILNDINNDVFKNHYASIYNTPFRTDIITQVKIMMQDNIMQNKNIMNQIK